MRVLDSPDYQLLLRQDEVPCYVCGADVPAKKCSHCIDMDGPLCRQIHPDGECCPAGPDGSSRCPSCIGFLATTKLVQMANHLELIKPDPELLKAKESDAEKREL